MEAVNPTAKKSEWSVIFAGDWAPSADHVTIIEQNPESVYGNLLPILRDADISVVNLECVLGTGNERIVKDGPHLSAPAHMVKALEAVPFDVMCLANNHTMDYGKSGLESTMAALAHNNLNFIGAGLTWDDACKPYITRIGDVRIAVVNVAEGEEGKAAHNTAGVAPFDLSTVEQRITNLKRENDLVFVVAHAGRECIPFPPPYVQTVYRRYVEVGADAVIGHHPHVTQGVEIYQGKPIAYSLGNFLFPIEEGELFWCSIGCLVSLHFSGTQFLEYRVNPYEITPHGLCLLDDEQRASHLKHLQQFSAFLSSENESKALWQAFANSWVERDFSDEMITISSQMLSISTLIRGLQFKLAANPTLANRIVRRLLGLVGRWIDTNPPEPNLATQRHGAAILRNRFDTAAHRELYLTALEQMMSGKPGDTPQAAANTLRSWKETRSL
ncbi:MAG: CapA family protein [Anaerolineae bacterium]|nr:CapA family protein [Anaerolineae bacterium]